MKNKWMKMLICLAPLTLSIQSVKASQVDLKVMSDQELSDTNGQALLSLSNIAPNDNANLMSKYSSGSNIGFYKLGLEADLELNTNIKNLQLGCGGVNGAGKCDIDIKNVSLSGLPSFNDANGNPVFSDGRAATSAKLTNPFMEFAIKNPSSASTRQVVGLRLSAEQITGLLTAGLANNLTPSSTDGIQNLSGFMRVAATTGEATTLPTVFGKDQNHQIRGLLSAIGINREFTSEPGSSDTQGVTIPSLTTGFNIPEFQVSGNRLDSATVSGIKTKIDSISLSDGPLNQLKVNFPALLFFIGSQAKIKLADGSAVRNLNMDITFNQALSMLHNIPLTGNGGYLSLQQQSILWPGSYISSSDSSGKTLDNMTQSDVSKTGWWMSFADPVQLGYLKATEKVDIKNVMPQVATLMTNELLKEENRVYAPLGSALGTLFGITMTTPKPIIVDLNQATLANPAKLALSNLKLGNQEVRANCYGNLQFC
ncbi:MAG: hypothetical protein H9855_09195 [Candidatus Acinetobacter avistercoris]|uniref:hypothetical protein n=1 Tax=Acinetobacter sp. KS-LM10 TaxID=3120518 RepID=UPI001F8A4929|nr:hypothetical protein [Candidatus Acinetobacter avistercoris]